MAPVLSPGAATPRRFLALMLAALFVSATFLALVPAASADSATATGWNLSAGRARTSAVADGNGNAYVVGGWELGITSAVQKVNLATGAVTTIANLPSPRYHTSAVWANGAIYAFGGYDGSAYLNQIVRVDPTSGATSVVAYLPKALSDTTAAFDGTHAYIFGGFTSESTGNPVVRFTPGNNQVVTLNARAPVYLHAATSFYDGSSGQIYILGGFDFSAHRRNVVRYTPSTDAMQDMGLILPISRTESALAWDGTYAYLFGSQGTTSDIVRFHPGSMTAIVMAGKMTPGRNSASATWSNGNAYVFGGLPDNYDGTNKLTEILRYNLAPGAPTGLTGSSTCAGAISLSWAAPGANTYSRLTGYKVYRAVNGGSETLLKDVGNSLSTTDAGASGSTHAYRVSAYSTADGEGPKGATFSLTIACPPSAPQGLTVTGGTRQVSLSWSAPASTNGAALTNYKIYRGTASGSETHITSIGTNTSFVDATLGNGETRYYKVSAVNGAGEGDLSTGASATTHSPPTAPQSPAASATAVGTITVTWSAPASNGGTALTGYKVYRDGTSIATLGATATSHPDSGRGAGVTHAYRVAALNAAGEGAQSTAVSATTWSAPGMPTNLAATASGQAPGALSVSWSAPAGNGGTVVTGYKVYRNGVAQGTVSAATTTFPDSGLAHDTQYSYHVAAINAVGESAQAGPATARTHAAPGAVTSAASAGSGAITVTWSAPASNGGTAITAYKVYRGTSAGAANDPMATLGASDRAWQDTGLGEGATYHYRVAAVNAVGEGASANAPGATTFARPSAPQSPAAATGTGAGQVVLSWSPPLSNGGSAVLQYKIYRGSTPGGTGTTAYTTTSSTSITDTGIPNGERRYYRVSAVNAAGEGAQSIEVSATSPTTPGAPLDVVASPGAQPGGQILLSWSAPAGGGPAIQTYRIYRSTVSGGESIVIDVPGTQTSYTDADLYPSVRFHYKVAAINVVGEGAKSAEAYGRASGLPGDPDGDGIPTAVETRICSTDLLFVLVTFISPDAPVAGHCQPLTGDYDALGYWDADQDLVADLAEPTFCTLQNRFDPADGICVGNDYGLPPTTNMELVANLLAQG